MEWLESRVSLQTEYLFYPRQLILITQFKRIISSKDIQDAH